MKNDYRSHLVDNLQLGIFRLRLQLRRPVDVGLALRRVVVLEVEARYLEVRLQLVVDGVLLLTGLQRDADEHLGGPAPVLLALVDVRQVLADGADLIDRSEGTDEQRWCGIVKFEYGVPDPRRR